MPCFQRMRSSCAALIGLAFLFSSSPLQAIPGSGLTSVSPVADVTAGAQGTWSFLYEAEDNFTDGLIRITIPVGWTAPQDTDSTAAGYVTVSSNHGGANPSLSIAGQVITVNIMDLPGPKNVTVVYGDDGAGINPGARAVAQTAAQSGVVFLVESDPTGASPSPIAASPFLNVVAGSITNLVFSTSPFTFQSTGEAGPMVVEARDAFGNPKTVAADQEIDFSSTSVAGTFSALGGGSFSPVTTLTMLTGTSSITFFYRDTQTGTPTVTASGTAQPWPPATQAQTVNPGPPFDLLISPQDTTITAGDFMTFLIEVVDANGNRAPLLQGRTFLLSSAPAGQFFLPLDHGTPIPTLAVSDGQDSTLLDYRNSDASGGAPHLVIVLSNDGLSPSLFVTTDVTVAPGPVDTAVSQISAQTPVVADGVTASTVTVTVTDTFANPVAGVTVGLIATGSAVATNPAGPTGPDGVAMGTVTNTVSEAVTVTATADLQALADSTRVTFEPGPVSVVASTVEGTSPVVADDVASSTITVTARDGQGNVISGAAVVVSVTPSGVGETLTQPGGVTDGAGQALGLLRSSTAGTWVVKATIEGVGVVDSAVVNFVAGTAAAFVWTHDGGGVAGVFETVGAEVRDGLSNRVLGYADTTFVATTTTGVEEWALGAGAQGVLDSLGSGQWYYVFSPLDSGMVNLRVKVTKAETVALSAVRGVATGTSSGMLIDHGSADELRVVSGNGQSAVVGTAVPAALVVRVVDPFGNTVDGESVTFGNVTGGGLVDVVTGGAVDSVVVSDGSGLARCEVWQLGTTVGANTAATRMAGGSVPVLLFTAGGTPGTGVNIVLTPADKNVTVLSETEVRARLTDQYGNVVPGERADILIKDGVADGVLKLNPADPNPTTVVNATARFGTTDASGEISVLYEAPGVAGAEDTLDAFGSGAAQGDVTDVIYTSVASGATDLRIVFVGGAMAPAGQSFSFRIEAVDGNGNIDTADTSSVAIGVDAGGAITFSETDFGVTVSQVSLAAGVKVLYGRGQNAGTWNITASDEDTVLTGATETVDILDTGVVDRYVVTAVDSVEAGVAFSVSVVARDAFGNTVSGANNGVTLVAVDAGDTTQVMSDTLLVGSATLSSGTASVGETYLRAVSIRVRVRDGSGNEGFSGLVKVTSVAAYRLAEVSGDSTGVLSGGTVGLAARVLDTYGNPVAGEVVSFSVTLGSGSIDVPGPMSDGSGRVDVNFTTGVSSGENRARATIGDGNPAGLESVEFVVNTEADGIASYQVVPEKTTVVAGEVINVEVRGFDANGNLVTNDSTTIVSLSSDTGNGVYGAPVGVLLGGIYTTTMFDTVAESVTLAVQTQGGGPSGSSPVVSVNPATPYEVVKIAGDASGLVVGSVAGLEVETRDAFGNVTPGVVVIFDVTTDPGGAFIRDAVNDSTDGIVVTDNLGRAAARLHTSQVVGAHLVQASILDGTPPGLETRTFTVSTVAGAIAAYTVTADTTDQTAGVALGFTVAAFDSAGNAVNDSTTLVTLTLDPGSGGVFAATPMVLQNGALSTSVSDTIAEVIRIRATTQAGSATGLSVPVTINPDMPAGIITASVVPDTITANGGSAAAIASDPIQDRYGNIASSGGLIRVSVDKGAIASPDRDPSTPATNEQQIDGSGIVAFDVTSDNVAGAATVLMTSVGGSASGIASITYAPPPVFVCLDAPVPSIIVPGDSIAFAVPVQNVSATGLVLSTGTVFEFNDGTRFFSAPLAAPKWIAPSVTDTLVFAVAAVDSQMAPTAYQPVLRFAGTDQFGATFAQTCQLPAASVRMSLIEIISITANPLVSRGRTENVTVGITNRSSDSAIITAATLAIPLGDYLFAPSPDLPDTIPPGMTSFVSIAVTIQPSSPLVTAAIDASVSGTVNGVPVSDLSLSPNALPQWTIESAASLVYAAGSLAAGIVSQGQAHSLSVTVQNQGQATVTLDTVATTLSFTDGGNVYSAGLEQATALAGNSSQLLRFDTVAVAAGFAPGVYGVALHLEGTENGAPLAADLNTGASGDSIRVVTPASVAYQTGSLTPVVVNKTTTTFFEITVLNSGGAAVDLDPDSSRFSFAGGLYDARLDQTFGATLVGGGPSTLRFAAELVSPAISSGAHAPTVRLVGNENGLLFTVTIDPGDSVRVQDAADITILSLSPSQAAVTADQGAGFQIMMGVSNLGQSTVRFDSARVRLVLGGADRTFQFSMSGPTAFDGGPTLVGGSSDFVRFNVLDNLSNPMDTGNFTIEGELWVTDLVSGDSIATDTNFGGKGSLIVQTPAALAVLSIEPEKTPVTVGRATAFEIRMAVHNDGESLAKVLFDRDSTQVTFAGGGGWVWSARPAFVSGDSILFGGEVDTVVFDVSQVGSLPGNIRIDGTVRGIEENSGRIDVAGTGGGGFGAIEVQTVATINMLAVVPSRSPVTEGADLDWEIRVRLRNDGESAVDLDLPGMTLFFQDEITAPVLQKPAALFSGSSVLAGMSTDSFVVVVDTTGTVSTPGSKNITLLVQGTEVNSGMPIGGLGMGIVVLQLPPQLTYNSGSLVPAMASSGTEVEFRLSVANNPLGTSTLRLDPAQTRLRFGGGVFSAPLHPSSTDSITGGASSLLRFQPTLVDTGIALGSQSAFLDLVGNENGNPYARTFPLTAGDLELQQAPQLSIKTIIPSQPTVTRGQSSAWDITMVVQNNGQATVDLDLTPAATGIEFVSLAGGNVTGDYVVTAPTALAMGGTLLPGGAEDSLKFVVQSTGDTTGTILLNGNLLGVSTQDSLLTFSDDTADGGSGSVIVQTPGVLDIVTITPSQSTLTAGQLQPWMSRMVLRNSGGAALQLLPLAALLEFAPAGAWSWVPRAALEGGGTRLDPGETDSLFFDVSTTATTGTYVIGGRISATELNSGDTRIDTTDTSGWGTVLVQTPADLSIVRIATSRDPVTDGQSTPWTVDVTVRNNGEASSTLNLAESRVAFATLLPPDTIASPAGKTLLEGDSSTVLTFTVAPTPAFATPGVKPLEIHVAGREANTDTLVTADSAASVTVQLRPDPGYVLGSLAPVNLTRGDNVVFELEVAEIAGASILALDPDQTQLVLSDGVHEVRPRLNASIADSILPAPAVTRLVFETTLIDSTFFAGTFLPEIQIAGVENGNPYLKALMFTGTDSVSIVDPARVRIDRILVSQNTVTASQTQDWVARMVVVNGGSTPIRVDTTGTSLNLDVFGAGDVTGEYTIASDYLFQNTGSDVLPAGQSDEILFTVDVTGITVGQLTIHGQFAAVDTMTMSPVVDNTFDTGSASVIVQTPASLRVTQVRVTQPTVTAGQNTDWQAVVYVTNIGEASTRLVFDATLPEIRALPASGFAWLRPPSLAGGTDSTLAGGEVDSLIFTADITGTSVGPAVLHARVRGFEINSGNQAEFDTEVQAGGFGGIIVQDSARVDIRSTVVIAPNAPNVNTGQTFGVRVEIANLGGADVTDVTYVIGTSGGSVPQPPDTLTASRIAAGTSIVDTFTVQANGTTGVETVSASIARALDANTMDSTLVIIGPHTDSLEPFGKTAPALLAIGGVTPSQTSVTRQQTQPWMVDVVVGNSGETDLILSPPNTTDLSFFMGPTKLNDYVVVPPTVFLSGNPSWTVAGGAADTLHYLITTTGSDTGAVRIDADLSAFDVNDLSGLSARDSVSVTVVSPSGLLISVTRVDPVTVPNIPQPNLAMVNSEQAFVMQVVVQNSGEALDSVEVQLASDGATLITPSGQVSVSLPADSSTTFTFDVTADTLSAQEAQKQVILTSIITRAISVNSGLPVTARPPLDNQEFIVIQKPADLRVRLGVTGPPEALDGSVSTGQIFTVSALVENRGSASEDGSGELTLGVPPGFQFAPSTPDSTAVLVVGTQTSWDIIAPAAAASARPLIARISGAPLDVNAGGPAGVSQVESTILVDVLSAAGFSSAALTITSPPGATDATLSTNQTFVVEASVVAQVTTVNVTVTLVYSSGLQPIDPVVRALADGNGAVQTIQYRVQAPPTSGVETVFVRFDGTDINTGSATGDSTQAVMLQIVPSAALTLSAVLASPEALDGSVSVGAPFAIKAVVENAPGFAGIDTTAARPRISMTLPAGYSLDTASPPASQAFTIGAADDSVTWIVRAPMQISGPDVFTIRVDSVPADENSGLAAILGGNPQVIAIQTDASQVTIENTSAALGITTRVVPKGTRDVQMMAMRIENPVSNADSVRLRWIDVALRDQNRNLVANPAATVTEFYALKDGVRIDGAVGQNPMRIQVDVLGPGAVIPPQGTSDIVLVVSVASSANLESFTIEVPGSSDMLVENVISTERILVVDKVTGQGFAGKLRSLSLVILSGEFSEYTHNYPNPFRAGRESTRIAYLLNSPADVSIRIFTLGGELVYERRFSAGEPQTTAGPQEVLWDGRNMSGEVVRNGLYVCRVEAGPYSATFKIAVAK